jgi:hypothetical protein
MTITRSSVSSGGAPTVPAFSATQQNKRDVLDYIKFNVARNCKLIALLDEFQVGKSDISLSKGMIKKTEVTQKRYECYNHTDYDKYITVTSCVIISSGPTYTLTADSTAQIKVYDTLYYFDQSTGKTLSARVDSITNTTVCVVESFGDTAFCPDANTVVGVSATAYPDNSVNPSYISKDFDNVYNVLQISREPVAISNTMLKSEFYATKDYFKLLKMINMARFYEKMERTWLFGNRPTGSLNVNPAGTALTGTFSTTQGAFNWAANSYDMNGNMTSFKLKTELSRALPVVGEGDPMICLAGFDVLGRIDDMVYDKVQYQIDVGSGKTTLQKWGINTKIIKTQTFEMELVNHKAFNEGELARTMFIFNPENTDFVHLPDRDIFPNVGIQENDRDGVIDEVMGECGFRTNDGGQSMAIIKNCW